MPSAGPDMIARRLKELRAGKGWSQEALARAAGLTSSAVARIEQGVIADPSLSTAVALARALGCTLDALLDPPDEAPQVPAPPRKGRPKRPS